MIHQHSLNSQTVLFSTQAMSWTSGLHEVICLSENETGMRVCRQRANVLSDNCLANNGFKYHQYNSLLLFPNICHIFLESKLVHMHLGLVALAASQSFDYYLFVNDRLHQVIWTRNKYTISATSLNLFTVF